MNQLDYTIYEIEQNGNLSTEHKNIIKNALFEHKNRMKNLFPNYDLFITGTGQSYGLLIEKRIIDSFIDLQKHTGDSASDANFGKLKIEIKSIKCTKGKSCDYIGSRIINFDKNKKQNITGSFQQVKPQECDWFIFHILYGNAERIFIIPSQMFSKQPGIENKEPGKLLLSKQHRSHPYEGQANIGTILEVANIFEIDCNYKSSKQNKYIFKNMITNIKERLDKINWFLPN